jgi:hypothetical protein
MLPGEDGTLPENAPPIYEPLEPTSLPPQNIRFTQETYSPEGVIDETGERYTVEENIKFLKDNPDKDLPPIRVFRKEVTMDDWGPKTRYGYTGDPRNLENGAIYTLDNRRLVAYQEAGRDSIPIEWADPADVFRERYKFSTPNCGTSICPKW